MLTYVLKFTAVATLWERLLFRRVVHYQDQGTTRILTILTQWGRLEMRGEISKEIRGECDVKGTLHSEEITATEKC